MMITNVAKLKGKYRRWAELVNRINDLRDEVMCDPECSCQVCTKQYAVINALETEKDSLGIRAR